MGSKINIPSFTVLFVLFSVFCCLSVQLEAQLQVGFYSQTCPSAEQIVRQEVMKGFMNNNGIAPGLVRMHFHDCFVRGCDASILIDSTSSNTAEKDSPINNPSLRGFEVIDSAKARLEAQCSGIVSCADILAFAARDSIAITKGPFYNVPAGRRDGRVSLASDVSQNIPSPAFNLNNLTQNFANKGLSQDEMVTLSGAHTIGQSHCSILTNVDQRLFNFSGTNGPDPTLDSKYLAQLQQECPNGSNDPNSAVPMDPSSPLVTNVNYYCNVLANRGLFTSDQSLLTDSTTASAVNQNSRNQFLWFMKFKAAIVKMGQIGVTTGSDGEIRTNCRVIN
ncbi:peroxidase 5-like [Silene latifolia]|uniref:peroxidase 5-like n=1 Tax=Silene latifolia TaxID=37657 RepID=UPI003D779AB4